ncbi:MAG: hypothetical protein LBN29_07285 [Mediterranea sp.]|jgi:hypothetical protein|nr:hypothetical protein [Mediterranea sp.]
MVDFEADNQVPMTKEGAFDRLSFADPSALEMAIKNGNVPLTRSGRKFVSLLSKAPVTRTDRPLELDTALTYYEKLGYDSLVPNEKFAALLTPEGELEVAGNIVKITPEGTYICPITSEAELRIAIGLDTDSIKEEEENLIEDRFYQISDGVLLYDTFGDKAVYDEIEGFTYDNVSDDDELPIALDADTGLPINYNTGSSSTSTAPTIPEPDMSTFPVFNSESNGVISGFFESIFGSTNEYTVKFSNKRRVKGSFYFYDYGVYYESGVQGWTDKKNLIGWSKTASDELRVGWTNIVLKKKAPTYYRDGMKTLSNLAYYPPQYMEIGGQRVNVATLAMPDYKPNFWEKAIAEGSKAIKSWLKSERPEMNWEEAEAFIVATQTDLYYFPKPHTTIKFNEKKYTHVFANGWMTFVIGYNSQTGFFVNSINQSNYSSPAPYFKTIADALFDKSKKTEIVSGEIFVCARFTNDWRGMKIMKYKED